jgi:hypothetical protein
MGLNSLNIIQSVQKLSPPVDNNSFDLMWVVEMLLEGDIELQGLFSWSSNYTFLTTLTRPPDPEQLVAVYKPCEGERPLWDFPEGSLCQREFATYLVSLILGWPRIPPVVFREEGPHGAGSLQMFVDADFEAHYFNLRHQSGFTAEFRRMALFDYVVNNADRKGGHCLKDKRGEIWAIDHGLTFHTEHKLRTVIWEFSDEAIPPPLLADLQRLQTLLNESPELCHVFEQVISPTEIRAFKRRIDLLLKTGSFPEWYSGHNVPYPPI